MSTMKKKKKKWIDNKTIIRIEQISGRLLLWVLFVKKKNEKENVHWKGRSEIKE